MCSRGSLTCGILSFFRERTEREIIASGLQRGCAWEEGEEWENEYVDTGTTTYASPAPTTTTRKRKRTSESSQQNSNMIDPNLFQRRMFDLMGKIEAKL